MPTIPSYSLASALAGTEEFPLEQSGVTKKATIQQVADFIDYNLPIATAVTLGGVKSGVDVTIDASGFVSVNDNSHNHTWSNITSTPTTLAGYGITDAATNTHTHSWTDITGTPTTLAGYGITDAAPSSHLGGNIHIDWTQLGVSLININNIDWATVLHDDLSGSGTNTHAQIDTHLGNSNIHIDWTSTSSNLTTSGSITTGSLNVSGTGVFKPNNASNLLSTSGSFLRLYGSAGAQPNNIEFYSNNVRQLLYSSLGNSWDFQANDIITSGNITAANFSGVNTGDQTITLTGDVTGSGTGTFATTIAPDSVGLTELAGLNQNAIYAGWAGASGQIQEIVLPSNTVLANIGSGIGAEPLSLFVDALPTFTQFLKGVVPVSPNNSTDFLRADGTWAEPPGTSATGADYAFKFITVTDTDSGFVRV